MGLGSPWLYSHVMLLDVPSTLHTLLNLAPLPCESPQTHQYVFAEGLVMVMFAVRSHISQNQTTASDGHAHPASTARQRGSPRGPRKQR